MKTFSFVAHIAAFWMIEIGSSSTHTRYNLYNDGLAIGEVEFPSHLAPKISVSQDGQVAIYAGCAVYLPKAKGLVNFCEEQEVHKLWFLGKEIFSQCDALLIKRDASNMDIKEKYYHNEIIIDSLLNTATLFFFQDLENNVFQVDLNTFIVSPSNYIFAK